MAAYYNEINEYAVMWLGNLIKAGLIADGDIDSRDIRDVCAEDIRGYNQCHFFAGLGGWSLALNLANWPANRPVWTGSCPCQPFSAQGNKLGVVDDRHLWPVWFNLIAEHQPPVVFGEQVASKSGREWLDYVFDDLEREQFSCGAAVLPAASVGAPHLRERLWWLADSKWHEQSRKKQRSGPSRRMGRIKQSIPWDEFWQRALPRFRAMDDGLSKQLAATDAIRNAIVPQVGAIFVASYLDCIGA